MKKILTSTAVVAAVAALSGALVACGDKGGNNNGKTDAQIAEEAISVIRTLYADKAESTPANYTVNGTQMVDGKSYNIKWTVNSEFANFAEYVKVGEMNDKKQVPITIKKATEEIEYTLKATVNVGKASASEEFKRKIPAGLEQGDDQIAKTLDFTKLENRTVYTAAQQVWVQDGVTVTNDKGASPTDITNAGDATKNNGHVRFYKGSTVTIAYPGMTSLLFYSTAAFKNGDNVTDYPGYLKTSLEATGLGTVTYDEANNKVTLVLASPMDSITFTSGAGQIRLTTLDVVANKNGTTDEDKVNGALLQLDLAKTSYTLAGTYDLPAKHGDVNVTWAVKSGSEYAEIKDGKLNIKSLPATEADVTLTATLSLNDASKTKDITVKLVNVGIENDGTEEHPYTAEEAWKVAGLLADGSTSTEEIYVTGYVALPGTYAASFNNFDNMYITDNYDAGTEYSYADYTKGEYYGLFYIYRPKAEGEFLTADGLNPGDKVTFKGTFANYKGTSPQLSNGTCVARIEPERTDVEDALLEVESTLTVTATGETALPASTVSGVTFTWSTEDTTYTVTDNKLNVAALPATPATVTLTVSATDGKETKTKTVTVTIKMPTNYGTVAAPISVTDALGIAADECKNNNDITAQVVYMTGKVTTVTDKGTYYQNIYLADLTDSTKTILVYSANLRTDVAAIAVNDVLVICGYITNYNKTIEFATKNGTNVYVESNVRGVSAITLGDHEGATVTGLPETATNGTEATFTVEVASGKTITAVKVNGTAITGTDGTYKFTVAGNATVTVETKNDGDADPTPIYTLTTSKSGSNNSYAGNCDVEVDGITWNIEGNSTQNPWRFGGKNLTNQDRKLTSKTVMTGKVAQVVINFGNATAKVNSVTLNVYKTDPKAEGAVAAYTKSVTYAQNGSYTINVPESEDWTDCYYQVVFNVTCGSSNQYATITTIVFSAIPATESDTPSTVDLPEAIVDEQ